MHIRLPKVKQEARGSKPWALGSGHCMEGQYRPWGPNSGETAKKGTIKPNTKYFKN